MKKDEDYIKEIARLKKILSVYTQAIVDLQEKIKTLERKE